MPTSPAGSALSRYLNDPSFAEDRCPDIVAWKLARSAIEHENLLVSQRLTWFFTSQAFLFTSFFIVFTMLVNKDFNNLALVPGLMLSAITAFGCFIAWTTREGLRRAHEATSAITTQYEGLRASHPFDPIVPPLHLWIEKPRNGHQNDLPMATLICWLMLFVCCLATTVHFWLPALKGD